MSKIIVNVRYYASLQDWGVGIREKNQSELIKGKYITPVSSVNKEKAIDKFFLLNPLIDRSQCLIKEIK